MTSNSLKLLLACYDIEYEIYIDIECVQAQARPCNVSLDTDSRNF